MDDKTKTPSLLAQRYEVVNAAWPMKESELPKLTEREAITAARRLYRFGYSLFDIKKVFRGPARVTSGNRYSYPRSGVLVVNAVKGWHHLVHDLSHYIHGRCTNDAAHRGGHAWVERQMIEYVVRSGWLDGKLKRPAKPPVERNVRAERFQRVCMRLAKWESRMRRAQTAIRKLRQSRRRYERAGLHDV